LKEINPTGWGEGDWKIPQKVGCLENGLGMKLDRKVGGSREKDRGLGEKLGVKLGRNVGV